MMLWAEEVVWKNLRGYEKKFDEAEWWTRLQNKPSPKGKRKTKTVNQKPVKIKKDVCLTSGGLVDDEVQ
ncbi:MAG: hypothetical protein ACLVDI_09370 [Thomasclavelia ramosa]